MHFLQQGLDQMFSHFECMSTIYSVEQMQVIGQHTLLEELLCQVALGIDRVVDIFQQYGLIQQSHPGPAKQRERAKGVGVEFPCVIDVHDHCHWLG